MPDTKKAPLGAFKVYIWCEEGDLNPHTQKASDFKSDVSTDSTILANYIQLHTIGVTELYKLLNKILLFNNLINLSQ